MKQLTVQQVEEVLVDMSPESFLICFVIVFAFFII